jgi:hypothetical protein
MFKQVDAITQSFTLRDVRRNQWRSLTTRNQGRLSAVTAGPRRRACWNSKPRGKTLRNAQRSWNLTVA